MTSLLLHWLNEVLSLHSKVNILERDLSNGYIFAEVLHIHGLEAHLDRYTNNADLATRVANLENLSNALAAAGIGPLNIQTKREILMENRTAILQLLLRIKEFIESKDKKLSLEQLRLRNVPSRVYEPRTQIMDDVHVVQDIEKRFVRETAQQYRPSDMCFYKDVNIAVHLRKFSFAQWQAENQKFERDEKQKNSSASQAANSMTKQRKHMSDKREFIRGWDKDHQAKWQETQRLYFAAERDDLRLETSLEERHRRCEAARLASWRADMTDGIRGFEKNIARLGLSSSSASGTDSNLRAISCADPGPLAHIEHLEHLVEDQGFRPSNNVKMMQELRARRTAQLAAEKDRRMRQMKTASSMKETPTQTEANAQVDSSLRYSQTIQGTEESVTPTSGGTDYERALASFIDVNRDILEANYERLRIQGQANRESKLNTLEQIIHERRQKTLLSLKNDCVEIIGDLIAKATASTKRQTDFVECVEAGEREKRRNDLTSSLAGPVPSFHLTNDVCTGVDEAAILTETFLGHSNVWESYIDINNVNTVCSCTSLCHDVEMFIRSALTPPLDGQLSTKWDALPSSRIITLYTSDDRGHSIARQVADDHMLYYLSVEELLEECLKNCQDQGKQNDVATPLSLRERVLSSFGPRVLTLRLKNAPIPEQLVVDIVLAALTAPPPSEDEMIQANEAKVNNGYLLHNFPRTVDEWKIFEKGAISANILDPDEQLARAAALESALMGDVDNKYASFISCAIVISLWEQPGSPPMIRASTPSSAEFAVSPSERRRLTQNGASAPDGLKRQSVVDSAIIKAEAAMEAKQQREKVEHILAQMSRLVRIEQAHMNICVLKEMVHLAIEVYCDPTLDGRVGVISEIASSESLPDEIDCAREARRSMMSAQDRIAWMVASKQLQLSEKVLFELLTRLRRLEEAQLSNLQKVFEHAQRSMLEISQSANASRLALDEILERSSPLCSTILVQTIDELNTQRYRIDKALILAEVKLGDAVEYQRVKANTFIQKNQVDLEQSSLAHVSSWIANVPLVCLELKEYVIDTISTMEDQFYVHFKFLRSDALQAILPLRISSSALDKIGESVKTLELACSSLGLNVIIHPEIERLIGQIATAPKDIGDSVRDGEPSHPLSLSCVASALVTSAMQCMLAIMRWSTVFVNNVRSSHSNSTEAMRQCVSREIRLNNLDISTVMHHLAETQFASWPKYPSCELHHSPIPTRHQRAAFLSPSQVKTLIETFKRTESPGHSLGSFSLCCEEFVSILVGVARQNGFPDPWHSTKALARVAIAWSQDQRIGISWRHVVFSIMCSQAIGIPTTGDIVMICQEVQQKTQLLSTENVHPRLISKHDYNAQVRLWFEGRIPQAATWKDVLFSLFTTSSDAAGVDVVQMLFTWCAAPLFPGDIYPDIASALLPQISRGLRRAFRALLQWSERGGMQRVGLPHVQLLLSFAGVESVNARLARNNGEELSWGPHEAMGFLAWCDQYDPMLSQRFLLLDTLAALTED